MPEWTFVSLEYEPWTKGEEVFVRSADTFAANSFERTTPAPDQARQQFFENMLINISWHLGSEAIPVFIDFNGDRRRMDPRCINHALAEPRFLLTPQNGPDGYVTHVSIAPKVAFQAAGQEPDDMTTLWKRIYETASKEHPELAMKSPGSKGAGSNWVIFKADLPPKITIDWKITKATVDLSFWPGASAMPSADMDLNALAQATSTKPSVLTLGATKVITVPVSAPGPTLAQLGEQKIKEALQIASALYKFYRKNSEILKIDGGEGGG
ncbi:hypothetical protein LB515_02420 [Mesorhizobium sp. CA15]|uniref:hypothetical protein n=1 Tax=Mesorhizobium sp. CA15 TaxID=2876641 RepID=UPI001CD05782|nr:hypothetical protein [Mesorhizobium sp. CA15]MBZ9864221.1 hypothetical protein [Mesorhizobium sp. CA15]